MKNIPRVIRRFVGILAMSTLLILLLNIAAVFLIGRNQVSNASPYAMAAETARALKHTADGYALDAERLEELGEKGAWAILLEEGTGRVIWQTADLPPEIPLVYSLADVAELTRGYVEDYPTYAGRAEDGLLVLGYPKESFWKHMWPSWDLSFIANLPRNLLLVAAANIALIFLIYTAVNAGLLRALGPLAEGIQALPGGETVHVRERGALSELAAYINRTSEILQSQQYQLRKRETARANWIAGISHDIRTPLSMVMGYAQQLQNSRNLAEEERRMAEVILGQSIRMRDLVSDLNLASKLEYNMQPLRLDTVNAVAVVRQAAADFINSDIGGKYPIRWLTEEELGVCLMQADKSLLQRAVSNLIQNSINHNRDGCTIYISVRKEGDSCLIRVEDDGTGATGEQIRHMNSTPYVQMNGTDAAGRRQGLGLLLVKQIAASHGGQTRIEKSGYGGLAVTLILPMKN